MKTSLFKEDESYTERGSELYEEVSNLIAPLIDKCSKENIKLKDLESIITDSVAFAIILKIVNK